MLKTLLAGQIARKFSLRILRWIKYPLILLLSSRPLATRASEQTRGPRPRRELSSPPHHPLPHLLCLFVYLFISSKLSRSSAPALHCSPRSPTRADPPGVSAGVLAPGRLAPVPSPLTQTPLVQP
jgi:hypothetical protein